MVYAGIIFFLTFKFCYTSYTNIIYMKYKHNHITHWVFILLSFSAILGVHFLFYLILFLSSLFLKHLHGISIYIDIYSIFLCFLPCLPNHRQINMSNNANTSTQFYGTDWQCPQISFPLLHLGPHYHQQIWAELHCTRLMWAHD